jgi:hypothetical protein
MASHKILEVREFRVLNAVEVGDRNTSSEDLYPMSTMFVCKTCTFHGGVYVNRIWRHDCALLASEYDHGV